MSKETRALQERIRTLKRDLAKAQAETRSLKAERDRSLVVEFGAIIAQPARRLHSELGYIAQEASPVRAQPVGPSSRSAETPPLHEPYAKVLRNEENVAAELALYADILESRRTGTGVHITGACPFCGRPPRRPHRRDSDSGIVEPPFDYTHILTACETPTVKADIAKHLQTGLGHPIDGLELNRWLRWCIHNRHLNATSQGGVTIYQRNTP